MCMEPNPQETCQIPKLKFCPKLLTETHWWWRKRSQLSEAHPTSCEPTVKWVILPQHVLRLDIHLNVWSTHSLISLEQHSAGIYWARAINSMILQHANLGKGERLYNRVQICRVPSSKLPSHPKGWTVVHTACRPPPSLHSTNLGQINPKWHVRTELQTNPASADKPTPALLPAQEQEFPPPPPSHLLHSTSEFN